ncbi:RHTO0S20e01398g1_1 [Rhodotorula toruloides]|uniref:RHTO0S20e01398g1_1 n=1 Tax=Rhodotorula toruloides TaxID=5286 RepID=A0A061BLE4_RHOTO|nr:RHTO0S20e01398g1_1 [Rhodotorula toruloides]
MLRSSARADQQGPPGSELVREGQAPHDVSHIDSDMAIGNSGADLSLRTPAGRPLRTSQMLRGTHRTSPYSPTDCPAAQQRDASSTASQAYTMATSFAAHIADTLPPPPTLPTASNVPPASAASPNASERPRKVAPPVSPPVRAPLLQPPDLCLKKRDGACLTITPPKLQGLRVHRKVTAYRPLTMDEVEGLDLIPLGERFDNGHVLYSPPLFRYGSSTSCVSTPDLSPSTFVDTSPAPCGSPQLSHRPPSEPSLLLFDSTPLATGSSAFVHALVTELAVVMKVSILEEDRAAIEREGRFYEQIGGKLDGVLPNFFGMFRGRPNGNDAVALLLSRHGKALEDFEVLLAEQRFVPFSVQLSSAAGDVALGCSSRSGRHELYAKLVRVHEVGIIHNDLEPFNVVYDRNSGDIRIIDLSRATSHACLGPTACAELQRFKRLLCVS